jgi:hypothetical protein
MVPANGHDWEIIFRSRRSALMLFQEFLTSAALAGAAMSGLADFFQLLALDVFNACGFRLHVVYEYEGIGGKSTNSQAAEPIRIIFTVLLILKSTSSESCPYPVSNTSGTPVGNSASLMVSGVSAPRMISIRAQGIAVRRHHTFFALLDAAA